MRSQGSQKYQASKFGRVAVVMGGKSAEREISLKSGEAVLAALLAEGIDAIAIDPTEELIAELVSEKIDRVFIALHGPGGEDGVIQGALEVAGIPYTGSSVMASAIGMDKAKTKLVWTALGIPTPGFRLLEDDEELSADWQLGFEFPIAVKPVSEGSSIGIHKIKDKAALPDGLASARKFGSAILLEQWIEGDDYTVAILNGKPLPAIRMNTHHEFFDFDAKYRDESTDYQCPCGLTLDEEAQLAELSLRAFNAVDCSGWGRVDFMRDAQGTFWVLEVNTVPGLTDHSLVPMAAAQAGLSYPELITEILATSL